MAAALTLAGALAVMGSSKSTLAPTVIASSVQGPTLRTTGPAATEEVKAVFDAAYGTFAPVTWSGTDSDSDSPERLKLPEGVRAGLLVFHGDDWFVAWDAFDADDQQVDWGYDLDNDGSSEPLMAEGGVAIDRLDLEVDGDWTLELWPLSSLPALRTAGGGDEERAPQCFLYAGPGGPTEFTYTGEASVIFDERTPEGTKTLLDVDGDVEAKRAIGPGPSVLCVNTWDGTWSITAP